jgi:hypothetical protein
VKERVQSVQSADDFKQGIKNLCQACVKPQSALSAFCFEGYIKKLES